VHRCDIYVQRCAEGGLHCRGRAAVQHQATPMCRKKQDVQQATHVATHPTHPTYPQSVCEAFEATYVATYKEAFEASVWVPRKPNGASAGAPEQARGPYRLSKPPAAGPVWSLAAIVHSSAQRFIVHSSAQRSPMQPNASTLVAACLTRNKKCSSKGWLIVVKLTVHMHPGEASRA